MTPSTAPLCPHRAECHEHMRETTESVRAMLTPLTEHIAEIRQDVKDIRLEQGRKDRRLTRVETVLAVLASGAVLAAAIGSCAVTNGYFRVPLSKAAALHDRAR